MMTTDKEYEVLVAIFNRYLEMILNNWDHLFTEFDKCDPSHLRDLCLEVIHDGQSYPFDKLNRWLGFIQGVLCSKGITSVDEEREFTRPLLHSLHDDTIPTYP